jgi:hypothetical protein
MTTFIPKKAVLTCHPETYSQPVREIEARAGWTQDNALILNYVLKADLTRLRIPPPRPPRKANHLWQHTCFEAFISVKGKPDYYELNFAPSGEWAAYSFQCYRVGMRLDDSEPAPRITMRNEMDRLELDSIVRLDHLRGILPHASLQLGLCAVIEDETGKLSYWALKHPPGKPDFHHPDAFALGLEPSDVNAFNDPASIGKR